ARDARRLRPVVLRGSVRRLRRARPGHQRGAPAVRGRGRDRDPAATGGAGVIGTRGAAEPAGRLARARHGCGAGRSWREGARLLALAVIAAITAGCTALDNALASVPFFAFLRESPSFDP